MFKKCLIKKHQILTAFFLISFILTFLLSNVFITTKQVAFGTDVQQNQNASLLVDKGIEHYQQGKFREAIEEWEQALTDSQRNNNYPSQAIIRGNLARAYQILGDLEESIKHWDAVVNLHQQLENPQETGRALTELAQAYSNSGRAKKAINILCGEEEAEIKDKEINIKKIRRQSNCLKNSALEISRNQKDVKGEVAALGSIGEAYRQLAKYNLAIKYLGYAKEKIDVNNLSLKSKISNSLGNVYLGKAQLWSFYTESAFKSDLPKYEQLLQEAISYYQNAWNSFDSSYQNALEQENKSAQMKALMNLVQVNYRSNQLNLSPNSTAQTFPLQANLDKNKSLIINDIEEVKNQSIELLNKLPDSPQKVYAAINLANLSTDNNITSPLTIDKGHIFYDQQVEWDLSSIHMENQYG